MIDIAYQHQGFGELALRKCLDYIASKPFGQSNRVALMCNKNNAVALHLYDKFGFKESGNKDEDEIENIKKACEITDNCFKYLLSYIKPGMTEKQIADEIEEYYKQRTDGLAFETIVASRRKYIQATCCTNQSKDTRKRYHYH